MNTAIIQEWFIRAAEIDRQDPDHVGPKPPRSLALPYCHDWVDKLGWAKTKGDQLQEDKLEEERRIFWERMGLRPTSYELAALEKLRDWLLAVDDEKERRALWAWARARAGGKAFNRWCFKIEGIHPETGRRRKNRAIEKIRRRFGSSDAQNNETSEIRVLRQPAENGDKEDTLEAGARPKESRTSWLDPAFKPFLITDAEPDFSWAEKRNERRRQLRKKRQQEEQERQDKTAA